MRMPVISFALVLASVAASRGVAAQEIPSFHAGQWAAEYTAGSWSNVGVMRFLGPRSALVLTGHASISHSTTTPSGNSASKVDDSELALALGVRRHSEVASRVLATTELGANIGLQRSKTSIDSFGNPVTDRQSQSIYGIYGQIGGQYFVASHLALGSVLSLNARVASGHADPGSTGIATSYHGFSLSTVLLPLRVTLYF